MIRRLTATHLILAIIGCASAVLLYYSMPHGIGIWHDAFVYINSAENLLNGQGLAAINSKGDIQPLIHFPPLYPLILSGVSYITRWPIMLSAKVIASFSYGFTVSLIGYLIKRYNKNFLHSACIVIFSIASPFISSVFRLAMTETIFLPIILIYLITFEQYLVTQKRSYLIASAIVTTLSWLTRYAGIFLAACSVMGLVFLQGSTWKKKISDALIYGGIVGGMYSLWALRNFSLAGMASGRAFYYHPIRAENLRSAATTLINWLSLVDATLTIRLGISALVVTMLAWMIFSIGFKARCAQLASKMLMIAIGSYGLMLFVSLTFFDASIRLDNRILAPLYVLLLIIMGIWLPTGIKPEGFRKISPDLLVFFSLGFIILNAVFSWREGRDVFRYGIGYESPRWKNSPTIEALENLQPRGPIYSNHSYAINLWSPFTSRWLPETRDWVNDQPIDDFEAQIDIMQDIILDEKGMLVLFTPEEKWVFVLMGERLGDPLFCGDGYIYPGSNVFEPLPLQIRGSCRIEQPE